MAKSIPEKKIADTLATGLDSLSIRPEWIVFSMADKGTDINMRLFDVIMAFINNWSDRFRDGDVTPDMRMYRACEMCYLMTRSLTVKD